MRPCYPMGVVGARPEERLAGLGPRRPAGTDGGPWAGLRPNVQTGGDLCWALQTDRVSLALPSPAPVPCGQDGSVQQWPRHRDSTVQLCLK